MIFFQISRAYVNLTPSFDSAFSFSYTLFVNQEKKKFVKDYRMQISLNLKRLVKIYTNWVAVV